ncbi:hypothetical protein NX059_010382 [Plenodomus lindquistii]|nr:hypothetical protein NX059_010382 [Plenodomus lindquistii]
MLQSSRAASNVKAQASKHIAPSPNSNPNLKNIAKTKQQPTVSKSVHERKLPASGKISRLIVRPAAQVKAARPPRPLTLGPYHELHDHVFIPGDSQTLGLPSGNRLGFADIGSKKSEQTWLFFHGTPGSRLGCHAISRYCVERKVRLIGLDRPGYGLALYDPNCSTSMLEWIRDVDSFVKHLELGPFKILAASGGAPYALTAAYHFPKTELLKTAIMCGDTHPDFHRSSIPMKVRINDYLNRFSPFDPDRRIVMEERPKPKNPTEQWLRDNALLSAEERTQDLYGVNNDDITRNRSWGFKLKDIDANPLMWYHGTLDTNTSEDAAQETVQAIGSTASIKSFPGKDHFTVQSRENWRSLLRWLRK